MKAHCFRSVWALVALIVTVVSAQGAIDFVSSGNIVVQGKLTTNYSGGNNLLESFPTDSFTPFVLSDGNSISGDFADDDGGFYLNDNGEFSLNFAPDAASGFFTLTLEGLLPQSAILLDGFDFVSGSATFVTYDYGNTILLFASSIGTAIQFSFADADVGTVVISGNLTPGMSLSGNFTSSAIPEPSSVALGLGAAAAVVVALRRRKA